MNVLLDPCALLALPGGDLPRDAAAHYERYELREVPLDAQIACAAAALPLLHRDPFDRVIVALAQARGLTVLTSDENIPRYAGTKTLW